MSKSWRSRGYLPHCDERGLVQHVVFGLADALPSGAPSNVEEAEARAAWADSMLDRAIGSRLLGKSDNAALVENALLRGDGERYALAAWCVMPTHVHVVVEPFADVALATILHSWKSFTAHEINKFEGRSGSLWLREYFDRFMRSPEQFRWTVDYVENNPVAAGLVATAGGVAFFICAVAALAPYPCGVTQAGGTPAVHTKTA